MNKQAKGFTLIELLVVISIIGILASVVLASLNSARQKGRDTKRISDVKQLQLALELYFDSNGTYPTALSTTTVGSFISSILADPTTGEGYTYEQLTSGTNYVLGTTLEDTGHSVFDADIDGTVGTTNCNDPLYCVQP